MAKTSHNRDILYIDELIAQYKTGTVTERNEALGKLINQFTDYFYKYVNILHGGEINMRNRDTYRFLSLFLAGQQKDAQSIARVRYYVTRLMQRFDREDIFNELVLIFIHLLDRYKRVENEQGVVNFVHYFTTVFRFRVKDWFNSLCNQPLMANPMYLDEGVEDDEGNLLPFISPELVQAMGSKFEVQEFERKLDLRKLDMTWVMGSQDPLFKGLSRYERFLLYNCYGLGKSVQSIADKLGRDKDTIWRHLQKTLDVLRRRLDIEQAESRRGERTATVQ